MVPKGDGVTDDTDSFLYALYYAYSCDESPESKVIVPTVTYKMSNKLFPLKEEKKIMLDVKYLKLQNSCF